MQRFALSDYLLQITKERMLLITSKRRMLQMQGEKWLNWLHSILGRFSTDIRKLKISSKPFAASNQGGGVLAQASLTAA